MVWFRPDTSGSGVAGFPTNHLYGFEAKNNSSNPTYQIDIQPGQCRSDDDTTDIVSSGVLTPDLTQTGVPNGLDTGTEQALAQYFYFAIYNPTTDTVASLLSLSQSSPVLPAGYTKKRLLGGVVNLDDILKFYVIGKGHEKLLFFDDVNTASGTAYATSWSTVDLSIWMLPIAEIAIMQFNALGGSGVLNIKPFGASHYFQSAYYISSIQCWLPCPSQKFEYQHQTGMFMFYELHGYQILL